MNLVELKEIFNENVLSYSDVELSKLKDIMECVNIKLGMDKETFDLYYEINVDDLLLSNMSNDGIIQLKNDGWSLNDDNKSLLLYIRK